MGNTSVKPHPRSRRKKQVHWKAADRPSPPGKPQLVSESEITPDVVTIRWDPPRYDGGSPITGYLVEHRRYGSPHWVRATPLLVRFTELSLSGLEPGWRYQFRISAENAVGLSAPGELSELLTVTLQRSAVTTPRFIDELKDTVALENEKVEFIAQFLGQPSPKICWFKDGFEIFSSRRIRIITENGRSVLTIHQSSLSDEGEIKCTATNRAGHASTKAKLTLEAPPSIRLPRQYEEGLLFELGEVIRLKVSIAGRPTPLVFWTHNNESIKSDDRYEIESTDRYSSVCIEEAKRTDRGEYQIKAVNKLGEAVASFLVTVTDKPSPPGQARVVMTLGRSVTLSWHLPADDGGCKIGNYIVEYFRIGWDVWLKAATSRQLTTTIGDLIEGSEYKFRVKAESPYGVSEPSAESDVVFIPDLKRGIITPSSRSRSQPRGIFADGSVPVAVKRPPRSQSSTRAETLPKRPSTPVHFYEGGVPIRPVRIKVKSPSVTPELSPIVSRRNVTKEILDKNLFDRSSMTRDLAYGTPEIQVAESELKHESEKLNQVSNVAVKSTVNVIHHQNTNPIIRRRASSPIASSQQHKPTSPLPRFNLSPFQNEIATNQNLKQDLPSPSQKSPSPRKISLTQLQKSPSPKPRSPSPRQRSPSLKRRSPSPKRRFPSPETEIPNSRQRPPSPVEKVPSPVERSPNPIRKIPSPRQNSPNPVQKISSPVLQVFGSRDRSPSPESVFSAHIQRPPSPLPETRRRSPSPALFEHYSRNRSPSPLRFSKSRSPSPNRVMQHEAVDPKYNLDLPKVPRDKNDHLSNSSEFMLVLLPEKQRGIGSASDLKFDFDENSVPPPMSLSAPELGAEPLILEPLRASVSSTELLHEHAIERFYQAIAAEEAEFEKRLQNNVDDNINRRYSTEVPKIQINSQDDQIIVGLERKNSLRRRLSAGGLTIPQQILWAQRRHSLRNTPDLTELPENNLRKFPAILDNKIVVKSEEMPEDNLRKYPLSLEDKRELFGTRQRSESEEREEEEFEKVRAKMAAQKKEQRKSVEVVKEEDWDEVPGDEEREYEESISESETESSGDERLRKALGEPPLYVEEEEETYHPGLMHRKIENHQKLKSDEPFEILTKPTPLPDPNFIPKPILKRREVEEIPEKPIRKSIDTNTKRQRSLSMFPQTTTNPKEESCGLENSSRQRSFSLFQQNNPPRSNRDVRAMKKRGRSPAVPNRSVSAAVTEISGMTAASVGMPHPARQPEKPVMQRRKSDEAIKVVVDHYGDIVRSYGQKQKTMPKVYLNADDLKAAAERQSKEDLREIERSVENLASPEELAEKTLQGLELPTDSSSRRRSFVVEASSALWGTMKEKVSAALAGKQEEDDVIPPEEEITPPTQRRGSAQINKRRSSRAPNKLDMLKGAKKGGTSKSESNWSHLRTPSPGPQGRKSSPSPMRRTSLIPPTTQGRRTSLGGSSPTSSKPKMKETMTQTAGYDDSSGDPKKDVLLAARQELLTAKAEVKLRTTVDYITDLAMFIVACWLYLFQNELLAIPVLLVMVYRQLQEEIKKKLPRWMLGKKKVKRK